MPQLHKVSTQHKQLYKNNIYTNFILKSSKRFVHPISISTCTINMNKSQLFGKPNMYNLCI